MLTIVLTTLAAIALVIAGLAAWRLRDHRADRAEMARLAAMQPAQPGRFSAAMVSELPEAARRFFLYAIEEGAPLWRVAVITMEGRFSLGTKDAPNYLDMSATQVLAAPEGFVWKMSGGRGLMRLAGSDSACWTRFWMAGIVPVARLGGDADHRRSAFGRYVAEAVFWTPAALLPGPDIVWSEVDEATARVTLRHGDLEQSVDVTVDADGAPVQVAFPRWTNANPEGVYRLQTFGGHLSRFRRFGGFRLPTHIEAGNNFGTGDYFPFFIADVRRIEFPANGPAA